MAPASSDVEDDGDDKDDTQLSFHSTQSLQLPPKPLPQPPMMLRLGGKKSKNRPKLPRGKPLPPPLYDKIQEHQTQQKPSWPQSALMRTNKRKQQPMSTATAAPPSLLAKMPTMEAAHRSNVNKPRQSTDKKSTAPSSTSRPNGAVAAVKRKTLVKSIDTDSSSDESDSDDDIKIIGSTKKGVMASVSSVSFCKKLSKPAKKAILQVDDSSSSSSSSDSELELPYEQDLGQENCVDLSEKSNEPLRPGDVIQYCSPLFVAGRPEGRRIAQVWNSDPKRIFPLVLSNNELLPSDHHVKRVKELYKGELFPHPGMFRPIENFRMKKGAVNKKVAGDMAAFDQMLLDMQTRIAEGKKLLDDRMAARIRRTADDSSISADSNGGMRSVGMSSKASPALSSSSSSSSTSSESSDDQEESSSPLAQPRSRLRKNGGSLSPLELLQVTAISRRVDKPGSGKMIDKDGFLSSDSDDDDDVSLARQVKLKAKETSNVEQATKQQVLPGGAHTQEPVSLRGEGATDAAHDVEPQVFTLTGNKYSKPAPPVTEWLTTNRKATKATESQSRQLDSALGSILGMEAMNGKIDEDGTTTMLKQSAVATSPEAECRSDGLVDSDNERLRHYDKKRRLRRLSSQHEKQSESPRFKGAAQSIVGNKVGDVDNATKRASIGTDLPSSDSDDDDYDDTLAPSGLSSKVAPQLATASGKPPLNPRRHQRFSDLSGSSPPLRKANLRAELFELKRHLETSDDTASILGYAGSHRKDNQRPETLLSEVYDVGLSSSDESNGNGRGPKSRKRKKAKSRKPDRPSAFRPDGLDTASPCPSSSEEDGNVRHKTKRARSGIECDALESGSVSSIQSTKTYSSDSRQGKKQRYSDQKYVWGRANVAKGIHTRFGQTPTSGRLTFVTNNRSNTSFY